MKTTVEIPDSLFHEAKKYAVEEGIPLREVIERGLRSILDARHPSRKRFKLRKRKFRAELLTDPGDWSAVRALIYEGRGA